MRLNYITLLSNWLNAYDKYSGFYDKSLLPNEAVKYKDLFYLFSRNDGELTERITNKYLDILKRRSAGSGDCLIMIETNIDDHLVEINNSSGTGLGWQYNSNKIKVNKIYFLMNGSWVESGEDEISSMAYRVNPGWFKSWQECVPRSFSVLPVASACNAKCAFCFSKASVSMMIKNEKLKIKDISRMAELAYGNGARRSVITGGGEPTLLGDYDLNSLIGVLAGSLSSVLMISNGSKIDREFIKNGHKSAEKIIKSWSRNGLSRLAISRHGTDLKSDAKIMGIQVDSSTVLKMAADNNVKTRSICVLQNGGVYDKNSINDYINRCVEDGVYEICFKELYVSNLVDNKMAMAKENKYCIDNRVNLNIVTDYLSEAGFVISDRLPWGSPVFTGMRNGAELSIAAYTEPSVGWERSNGLLRSWNFMSDGKCLASLEDFDSLVAA